MKSTTACIAAVCLVLASGALGAEESKTRLKTYNYPHGEVIHSFTPFWDDSVMYAVCKGADAEKNCKVYLESTDPAKATVQSCKLKLKYTGRFDRSVILTNAGNSKAVFAVNDNERKSKLVNVNLNNCTVHEVTYEITRDKNVYLFWTIIVPHPDGTKYDVLFSNKQLCNDFYCIATYDYEGNVVKAPTTFLVRYKNCNEGCPIQIAYDHGAYIIVQVLQKLSKVHFVKDDGTQLKNTTLFAGNEQNAYFFSLSTKENKFGFCTINEEKIVCQQYDVEGKIKLVDHEFKPTTAFHSLGYADVLNVEKGLITAWFFASLEENYFISVAHVDEQGKQGKIVTIDAQCVNEISFSKLYKSVSGEYCINSICMPAIDAIDRSKFKLITRCFLQTELF